MILNKSAHQKFSTWKPLPMIQLANKTMTVLMTKRNNPNVIIVIGKERNCNIGFTIALRIPKTIATRIAEPKPLTDIPGNNHAVK